MINALVNLKAKVLVYGGKALIAQAELKQCRSGDR